jgi:Holliday junction resolvase RusA-like endonuclease
MKVKLTVEGTPVPQGSMSAFVPKGWTRAIITSANPKLKLWRATVNIAAQSAMRRQAQDVVGKGLPVWLELKFYFQRPQKFLHPVYKTTRVDLDKLCRAIKDSLTGVVYVDDCQVVELYAVKMYGLPERVEITAESHLEA